VRNASVQKYRAFRQESVACVERYGISLGVQTDLCEARFVCHPHEFPQ